MNEEPTEPAGEEAQLLYDLIADTDQVASVALIGASALIPLPFVDDLIKAFLERRLVRVVAEREGLVLSKAEQERLTQKPPKGCCALGCLSSAFLFPLKKVLRKMFYFLEIKRSVDQSTTALAQTWLFRLALRRKLWEPGMDPISTDRLRTAMEAACHSQGVKPLEVAISSAFSGAKGTLRDFGSKFASKFRESLRNPNEEQLEAAVTKLERDKEAELVGLSQRLADSLSEVSESYLVRFAQQFQEQLAEAERALPGSEGTPDPIDN